MLEKGKLLQIATPEQIYRQPITPFVARFTGVAGELPGRVVHVTAEGARVVVGASIITARTIGTLTPGAAVQLLVRPAATRLQPRDDAGEADLLGGLEGVVADVAYRGRGYDHVVVCPSGTLTAVHDPAASPAGRRCEYGSIRTDALYTNDRQVAADTQLK